MVSKPDLDVVFALLEKDTLKHIVTLKMLCRYSDEMTLQLLQRDNSWALLSFLPVPLSDHWDKKGYSEAKFVVFIDGNSNPCKSELLERLPPGNLVIKTGDEFVKGLAALLPNAMRVSTFVSFTTSCCAGSGIARQDLRPLSSFDDEAWRLFMGNGYQKDELRKLFNTGARWFGSYVGETLAAACFVFPNYKNVWEIGGVNTQLPFQRQGIGKTVVGAALDYLLGQGLIPRYQARWDNTASIRLARSCGLSEYMRVDHFFLGRPPQ